MNAADPDLPPDDTTKSVLLLFDATPLGSNAVPAELAAKATINGLAAGCGWDLPSPSYSVEVWLPLLAIHAGSVPVGIDTPQGLTRLASTFMALPAALSATRLVIEKALAAVTVSVAVLLLLE